MRGLYAPRVREIRNRCPDQAEVALACVMRRTDTTCAYCGVAGQKLTGDHVFPRGLFPSIQQPFTLQRITVPACEPCNRFYSLDEDHFRFVVALAGSTNPSVSLLWEEKIARSFNRQGGARRISEVMKITERVSVDGEQRLKIYPARDERVLGIVRKCVRGLAHHHRICTVLADRRVSADVQRFNLPTSLEGELQFRGDEPDVVQYAFVENPFEEIDSFWLIRFFRRTTFMATVSSADTHPARVINLI